MTVCIPCKMKSPNTQFVAAKIASGFSSINTDIAFLSAALGTPEGLSCFSRFGVHEINNWFPSSSVRLEQSSNPFVDVVMDIKNQHPVLPDEEEEKIGHEILRLQHEIFERTLASTLGRASLLMWYSEGRFHKMIYDRTRSENTTKKQRLYDLATDIQSLSSSKSNSGVRNQIKRKTIAGKIVDLMPIALLLEKAIPEVCVSMRREELTAFHYCHTLLKHTYNKLFFHNIGLARLKANEASVANPKRFTVNLAAGLHGLHSACERFDVRRGWKFSTYAGRRIKYMIRKKYDKDMQMPCDLLEDPEDAAIKEVKRSWHRMSELSPSEGYQIRELQRNVEPFIRRFSSRDQDIFWLFSLGGYTQPELAIMYDMCGSSIGAIVGKIARRLAKTYYKGYAKLSAG